VATPTSAIPAALASADTSKKGSAVVMTLSCALMLWRVYKQTIKNNIFSFQKLKIIKQI
jgi:hypothetical protein